MRVVAFSDAHLASPETREYFGYEVSDYENLAILLQRLVDNPPHVVVNLGDWWEPFYDKVSPFVLDYRTLRDLTRVTKIYGNHDRGYGVESVEFDGIIYEHGHQGGKYTELWKIRGYYKGKKVVHGHTHHPLFGCPDGFPLDVGSITFNGTYGEIVDGVPHLRKIEHASSP